MGQWKCLSCQEIIKHSETNKERIKGIGSKHTKKCIECQKSMSGWPIPVWEGKHCCPFRYQSCMYTNDMGSKAIQNHCNSVNCLGSLPEDTVAKVYSDAPSNYTPSMLGQWVQKAYNPNAQVWISYFETSACLTNVSRRSTLTCPIKKYVTDGRKSPKFKQFIPCTSANGSDDEATSIGRLTSWATPGGGSDDDEAHHECVTVGMETEPESKEVEALQLALSLEHQKISDMTIKSNQNSKLWEAERCQWEGEITRLTVERVRWETKVHAADEVKASSYANQAAVQQKYQQCTDECEKLRLQLNEVHNQRDQWSVERTAMIEACNAMATNTLIFHDNKQEAADVAAYNYSRIPKQLQNQGIMKHYHCDMLAEYLQQTYNDFASVSGTCRIIHATPGASTGLDIQGVMIIIQYGIPKNLSEALQQGGRAVRDGHLCGLYLMMIETWALEANLTKEHVNTDDPNRPSSMNMEECPDKIKTEVEQAESKLNDLKMNVVYDCNVSGDGTFINSRVSHTKLKFMQGTAEVLILLLVGGQIGSPY
ncbi:hypothetical protein EV702DRAFT_1051127 [Suillus placidus]|uniref:Helicase C-terminal domain-containing protein n=1 Tax=Suillus placidus TaxID=48579 RepID=A0A9P6ZGV7_9AGAM|nr:hypothetical protein EV702DRAFT_1051127 [Suillus placidus]